MDANDKNALSIKNTRKRSLHKKQAFWQILVPLIVISLVYLVLFFYFLMPTPFGSKEIIIWAHISLIYIIIPFLILGVLILGILFLLILLIRRSFKFIPKYGIILQRLIYKIEVLSSISSSRLLEPMFFLNSWAPAITNKIRYLIKYLLTRTKRG